MDRKAFLSLFKASIFHIHDERDKNINKIDFHQHLHFQIFIKSKLRYLRLGVGMDRLWV